MSKVIFSIIISSLLATACSAQIGIPWSLSKKKAFVEQCLHDTNVFVKNAPLEKNPHRNLSPDQITALWKHAQRDGTILHLFPDGLPRSFQSSQDYKPNGPARSWYPNGQSAADEIYDHGIVAEGWYWDEQGNTIGRMTNGTGRQLIYYSQESGPSSSMTVTLTEYGDSVKNGIETTFNDQVKTSEQHYENGKLNGLSISWDKGKKIHEQNYKNGQLDGSDTSWFPSGQILSSGRYADGHPLSQEVFKENGVKFLERTYGPGDFCTNKYFYENGELMVAKTTAKGDVVSGGSYDPARHLNGEVKVGSGTLVNTFDRVPYLETYQNGKMTHEQRLPFVFLGPGISAFDRGTNHSTFHLAVIDESEVEDFKLDVSLPPGITCDENLSFATNSFQGPIEFGPFQLKFPTQDYQWVAGDTVADIHLQLLHRPIFYQTAVLHEHD